MVLYSTFLTKYYIARAKRLNQKGDSFYSYLGMFLTSFELERYNNKSSVISSLGVMSDIKLHLGVTYHLRPILADVCDYSIYPEQ